MSLHAAVVRGADPPLNPSSDQARRLLEHELSKPKYGDRTNPIVRAIRWFLQKLSHAADGVGGIDRGWMLLILLVLAVLIGLALTRLRRRQSGADTATTSQPIVDLSLDPGSLRAAAARSLSAGDLAQAYVEYFRAMALTGVERTIVSPRPGSTAHEVTTELARAFPDQAAALATSGDLFDAVRYGERTPSREAVEQLSAMESQLRSARPFQHGRVAVSR